MSSDRRLSRDFWPWNTLRSSHLSWQALESRLIKARQQLALEYQATFRLAGQLDIDTGQGILRSARSWLDQPHDPLILAVRTRLGRMFALQGKSLFRRAPSVLASELSHYAADIEKVCRLQDDLSGRLRLSRGLMTLFCRSQEFCRPNFFRLAVISPESARLLFHLRQKRARDRQAIQNLLARQGRS